MFVIFFGYLIPTILLRNIRWKTSILSLSFLVSVQIPLWYRKILVINASKYCTRSKRGHVLFVSSFVYLCHAADVSPFLLLMSHSVSNFDPSNNVFYQVSSPLCLIVKRSVFSSLTHSPKFCSCCGTVSWNWLMNSGLVDPALQSSAYSCPTLNTFFLFYLFLLCYCMCDLDVLSCEIWGWLWFYEFLEFCKGLR